MSTEKESQYYIGRCPICGNYGMLEIVVNISSKECFILCDECSAEWANPEDALKNINGKREFETSQRVRNATYEEIKNLGWEKYLL